MALIGVLQSKQPHQFGAVRRLRTGAQGRHDHRPEIMKIQVFHGIIDAVELAVFGQHFAIITVAVDDRCIAVDKFSEYGLNIGKGLGAVDIALGDAGQAGDIVAKGWVDRGTGQHF